jgi:hypothetical protein
MAWRRKKAAATPTKALQPPAEPAASLGVEIEPGVYQRETCMGKVTTLVPGRARAAPADALPWLPWRPWGLVGRRA